MTDRQAGKKAYEVFCAHCLEKSKYWTPIKHPAWRELSKVSQDSWIATARRNRENKEK